MTFWSVVKSASSTTVHFTGTNPQGMRLHLPNAPAQEKIIVKIYYQASMRLQVFTGSTFVEDLNRQDGKSKELLVLNGRLSANNVAGGYTQQVVHLTDTCRIGGASEESSKCMTPSNTHGANWFNRAESLLEILLAAHEPHNFIEIKSMPVVAVSMGVSTSVADFYKVKDAFLSNLASTLGIDLSRITIVDVVAGNARRRRALLEASAVVNFEVEPSATIELNTASVTVLEDVATVTIQVTRSVNIMGECGVSFSVSNHTSDNGVPNVNFVAQAGFIRFESREETKSITIQILSEVGYRAEDVQFTLMISDVENATVGATQAAVITVRNVHMPAPAAPVMVSDGTTSTELKVAWSTVSWPTAPSLAHNQTLAWNLECRDPDVPGRTDFQSVSVPFATWTSVTYGGLSTYRRVQCRIRVEAMAGWSLWSGISHDMYTLPVCGDGNRQGTELCDDAAQTAGCSASCTVESGYACALSATGQDVCNNGCQNGTLETGEACDSGLEDGCDAKCRVETGWACSPYPVGDAKVSVCSTIAGDGFRVVGREDCDDGNTNDLDGCSNLMTIENGSTCIEDLTKKSICQKCGNGILEGTEVCDDSDASKACLSCASLKAGWVCSGGACVAGPARVAEPVLSKAQETSIEARWTAPATNGLAISHYVVQ